MIEKLLRMSRSLDVDPSAGEKNTKGVCISGAKKSDLFLHFVDNSCSGLQHLM